MRDNDNSGFNPFLAFLPRKFETKSRNQDNPFAIGKNEFQELNFNNTIKSKPRPMHYPNLKNELFDNNELAPFHKGDQDFTAIFKGYGQKDDKKEDKKNVIFRPNINIYICDPNYFKNNKSDKKKENTRSHIKYAKKKSNPFKVNYPKKEEDKMYDLIVDLEENANAPSPADCIPDVIKMMQRMTLNDREQFSKVPDKNDKDKIYTNDGKDFQA